MTKKEIIIQWLKDNNVFEQFCNNSRNEEIPVDILLINGAFRWGNSPEGSNYWSIIADKYIKWYKKEFDENELDKRVYVNFHEINK